MSTVQRHSAAVAPGAPAAYKAASAWRFDLLAAVLGAWFIAGIFTDGWAHNHIARLETFFTPWHAALYSGYAVNALFFAGTLVLNHRRGLPWRRALPEGYGMAFVGVIVFAIAGGLDLLWHQLNGIEQSIQALFSPTHLLLATGAFLVLLGPARSLWLRATTGAVSLWALLPAVLSLAYCALLLLFFTQFAHPIVKSMADVDSGYFPIAVGAASIILQTLILMGVVLLAVRRWRLPFGTLAVIFGLNYLGSSILASHTSVLAVTALGVLIGLIADGLALALRPSAQGGVGLRLFAFVTPLVFNGVYFAALAATKGLVWPVNVWTGTIYMAAAGSLLLSLAIIPPRLPATPEGV